MTEFTPFAALAGGALIGLSAVLLMLTLGRIMGATGILTGFILPGSGADWAWRAAVLAGMVSAPLIHFAATGAMPAIEVPVSTSLMLAGGFIVGMGVTLGAGCTSGHGVCGMARLSARSVAATLTFMATTAATVFVIRHMIGV
jgi:uncharacterized membrane protein YedE/YeeE